MLTGVLLKRNARDDFHVKLVKIVGWGLPSFTPSGRQVVDTGYGRNVCDAAGDGEELPRSTAIGRRRSARLQIAGTSGGQCVLIIIQSLWSTLAGSIPYPSRQGQSWLSRLGRAPPLLADRDTRALEIPSFQPLSTPPSTPP